MSTKIGQKIVGYAVVDNKTAEAKVAPAPVADAKPAPKQDAVVVPIAPLEQVHEAMARPEVLDGKTYKIKSPLFEHALYITITDVVLNRGTQHESRRPFEVFINSKNMEQFQWVVALTRVMSAVFRKGGDVTFLVEELRAVFDPKGGYFKSGGVYMPSLVAELGCILERHLQSIGLLRAPELDDAQKELIATKRAAYEAKQASEATKAEPVQSDAEQKRRAAEAQMASSHENSTTEEPVAEKFPQGARECQKCHKPALIRMDNCDTCLSCGYSKCG